MLQGVKSRLAPCAFSCVSWPVALDMFTRVCRPYLPHRNPYSGRLSFFLNVTWCFKLLSCESYLDVLNTGHPLGYIVCRHFHRLLGCLFIFLTASSAAQMRRLLCPPLPSCCDLRSLKRDPFQPCLDTQIPRQGVSGLCLCRVEARVTRFSHVINQERQGFSPLWTGRRVSS